MKSNIFTYLGSVAREPNIYIYIVFGFCIFVGTLSLLLMLSSWSAKRALAKARPSESDKQDSQMSAYEQIRIRLQR